MISINSKGYSKEREKFIINFKVNYIDDEGNEVKLNNAFVVVYTDPTPGQIADIRETIYNRLASQGYREIMVDYLETTRKP